MNVYKTLANMLAFTLVLTAVPCAAATPKLYQELGADNLSIIKNAKHVTMLQVTNMGKKGPSEEIHLTSEQVERFKRNLLDDHNFNFAKEQSCRFLPELSFKIQDESDQTLHLFVSLSCNQILFGSGQHSVVLNYGQAEQRLNHFFEELLTDGFKKNETIRKRASF